MHDDDRREQIRIALLPLVTQAVSESNTLEKIWALYVKANSDAWPVKEHRQSFFAGAAASFELFMRTSEVPERDGIRMLDTMLAELKRFADELEIGRA